MIILGIETSCDETAASVLDCTPTRTRIRSHVVSSQIALHQKTSGIVPEVAAREHVVNLPVVIEQALREATPPHPLPCRARDKLFEKGGSSASNPRAQLAGIDLIAVTAGPGLITSLLVGTETAKTMSYLAGIPLVAVNHLEGHLAASLLNRRLRFPIVGLIVSGGHTELVLMHGYGRYDHIGRTRDDAAGEAFDKVAILLGLPYPGGPAIAQLARKGNPRAIAFPRPMLDQTNFDFSFSGLKTAVRNHVAGKRLANQERADLAASFQAAVCDVLVAKTIRAAKEFRAAGVTLSGGVSANLRLRRQLAASLRRDVPRAAYYQPPLFLTGDNATMIAAAGYQKFRRNEITPWAKCTASPTLPLTTSPRD